MKPSYIDLHEGGELTNRIAQALGRLAACDLCPRECGVDRAVGELGACRTGRLASVSSFDLHFGEEEPLVGEGGSGTVFVSKCNLGCVFCQNWEISHGPIHGEDESTEVHPNQLAWMMLELQRKGAENINFVSPSHVVPQILEALPEAIDGGLKVPLVYNCGGYDSVETLKLLEGIFDIYMPDAKFWDSAVGKRFCGVSDYSQRAQEAIAEMHRQVGDLKLNESGIAQRGVLVRHLVLPHDMAGTDGWASFLADLSPDTFVNIMEQYRPCHEASEYTELSRPVSPTEMEQAREAAERAGLMRLYRPRGGALRFLLRKIARGE